MEFGELVKRFAAAAASGNGEALADLFTADGTYDDYFFGPSAGREAIKTMLAHFGEGGRNFRWEFFDPVVNGTTGYAWSLSSFTSLVPQFKGQFVVIDGISRFTLRDGLIAEYRESVNGGVAMAQLGVEGERMAKIMTRWSGWLKDRPETKEFLKRSAGWRTRK